MSLKTPVAFLIFNRPDLTKIVFETIRQAEPPKLLVVADGPRFPEEQGKCLDARSVLEQVDWDCQVITNFSETNLGCKQRIASGLNWVFSQVEEAIILEDDCLPDLSFFQFCETLLNYYRYDERIMHISGNNFQFGQSRTQFSYYFSKYSHIWGWATWRRAWQYYDVEIVSWPKYKNSGLTDALFTNIYEKKYWSSIFDAVSTGHIDTWDYQWLFTCWLQNGLSIVPDVNLVSNLGFREDATHVKSETSPLAQIEAKRIDEINHPSILVKNFLADEYVFDNIFGGNDLKKVNKWHNKLRKLNTSTNKLLKKVTSILK